MSKGQSDDRDWSSDSEAFFRAARGDHDPGANDYARVRLGLARRLAGGAGAALVTEGGMRAAARKGLRGAMASNVVRLSLAVACVAAGAFAFARKDGRSPAEPNTAELTPRTPISSTAPPNDERARVSPSKIPAPSSGAGNDSRVGAPPAPARPSKETKTTPSRSGVPSSGSTPAAARPARATEQSVGATRPDSKGSAATATSRKASEPESRPERAESVNDDAVPSPSESAHAEVQDDSRAELALVELIHGAMQSGKPTAALALCAEHQRRWPHGTFALEREGVRAIASCQTRSSDAERRARAFLASYPRATLAPRIAAACASQLSAAAHDDRAASGKD